MHAHRAARRRSVVPVGCDRGKLDKMQNTIEQEGQRAVSVVCNLSDIASARRPAAEIIALHLPIVGLLNNAGVFQMRATTNAPGWDMTFATNHLGPFALTAALVPHLPDGANIVFVGSGVEDPERKAAVAAGFRGGRYVSAEASAHGERAPGGSAIPGEDAYATSKQCDILTVMALARETPRLHFNALEPGFNPGTGLGREVSVFLRFLLKYILPPLAPFRKFWSNPKRAARVAAKLLVNASAQTGIYCDDGGQPMLGSTFVRDPKLADRVVAETRALLSTDPT
jgi:NAD(P)-dependent dehydrogenase (short-subunit alcohol dehydrogenase family)